MAEVVRQNSAVRISVEGHTDSIGPADYNQSLSERRAEAVRDMLINSQEVSGGQVTAVGRGESVPIADNMIGAGRATNRRVQFILGVAGGE